MAQHHAGRDGEDHAARQLSVCARDGTLMGIVRQRVKDQRVLKLIRHYLQSGVMINETLHETCKSAHGPWRLRRSPAQAYALPARYFSNLGSPSLLVKPT